MQESKCGDVGYMDAHCTSLSFQLNPCNVSLGTDALHGFWHHDIPVHMADASEGIPGRRCSQKWLQARNKETISKSFSMFPLLRLCLARPSGIFRWSPQVRSLWTSVDTNYKHYFVHHQHDPYLSQSSLNDSFLKRPLQNSI